MAADLANETAVICFFACPDHGCHTDIIHLDGKTEAESRLLKLVFPDDGTCDVYWPESADHPSVYEPEYDEEYHDDDDEDDEEEEEGCCHVMCEAFDLIKSHKDTALPQVPSRARLEELNRAGCRTIFKRWVDGRNGKCDERLCRDIYEAARELVMARRAARKRARVEESRVE